MRRSDTTSLNTFTRSNVIMSFSSSPGSSPVTTIILPVSSTWTSGLHWHETHTEYLEVSSGAAWVSLDGVSQVVTSADGPITVPKFARHEWRRPRRDEYPHPEAADVELVVREWTDPADGQKEIFFRNLNSVIIDTMGPGRDGMIDELWLTLQLFVIFYRLDNYPVLWNMKRPGKINFVLQRISAHCLLWFAMVAGKVLGAREAYDEYTPRELIKKL